MADAYEVVVTSRPHRRPVRLEAARREQVARAGTHFDPDVVRAFLWLSPGDLSGVMGSFGFPAQMCALATVPRAGVLVEVAPAGGRRAGLGSQGQRLALAGAIDIAHVLPSQAPSAPNAPVLSTATASGSHGMHRAARPAIPDRRFPVSTALGLVTVPVTGGHSNG